MPDGPPADKRIRLGKAALLATLALTASASPAAAVPIGQVAAIPHGSCGGDNDWAQLSVASGNSYAVPGTGTIISWSTRAGFDDAGLALTMKVFRHVSGSTYSVVGRDGPHSLTTNNALHTFASNVPVQAGDLLGLYFPTSGFDCLHHTTVAGDTYLVADAPGDLPDGSSGTFTEFPDRRLNLAAEWTPAPPGGGSGSGGSASLTRVPSNLFDLGKLLKNKKKGIAFLLVNVPGPGELGLAGKGVQGIDGAGIARKSLAVSGGQAKLRVAPAKGKKGRKVRGKLRTKGKARVNVRVTYVPTGGTANTQAAKVKLVKK